MKLKLATIVLSVFAATAATTTAQTPTEPYRAAAGLDAEFQIFMNSHVDPAQPGRSAYDFKYVSHPGNIVPATFVYPSAEPVNALCFYGNPEHALILFKIMTESMDVVPKTTSSGQVFLDPARNYKPWLQIDGANAAGERFVWFDRVRRCDAPASENDRRTTPVFLKPYVE